jgi:hypothetical protein
MAIILKANKVNLFVSSVLFVFWYHSPNILDTPHTCNISWLRVKKKIGEDLEGNHREITNLFSSIFLEARRKNHGKILRYSSRISIRELPDRKS